jgi:hypothetical protein
LANPPQSPPLKISKKQSSKQAHSDLELVSTKGFAGFSDSNGLKGFNREFLIKLALPVNELVGCKKRHSLMIGGKEGFTAFLAIACV